MTKHFTRNRNTWVAYALLAFYSYFLNILGPITPFLHDEFHLSYTISSLHFSAFAVGILVIGLGGHLVIERIGRWQALSWGAFGLGIGGVLLTIGRTPALTIGAAFVMGCVGSLILAVVPVALSEEHGALRGIAIAEANVVASVLGTAAPFLVGWLARMMLGWRPALILGAVFSILIGGMLFRPRRARSDPPANGQTAGRLPLRFWFYWVALTLAVSVEFCMIFWSADYMERSLRLPRASAAQAVSLFLLGMIVGRLGSSRLLRVFSARQVVFASILIAILGFGLYWTSTSPLLGLVGLALCGLGVAALYPLLLSLAIGAAPGSEAAAGARTTLASGVAILALPLVLGGLADLAGLKLAFLVIAVLLGTLLLMMLKK
jgi:fucose permease